MSVIKIGLAVAAAVFACSIWGGQRVLVLHTNDTHSHIDDGNVTFSQISAEKVRLRLKGENVMLVDAGDYSQGTAYGVYDDGRSVIDIMNAAGYDAATIGNHEFDYGLAAMTANVARCAFPVVCCNFVHRMSAGSPATSVLPSYAVVTSGTVRVAFVGITTPTTLVSSKPTTFLSPLGDYYEWDFIAGKNGEELYGTVQRAVDEAAAQADYVVVLGHLGISQDCAPCMSTDVIAHTTNFVAFVDGHSHTSMEGRRVKNAAGREVILAQAGCHLDALGCLTLEDGACTSAATVFPSDKKQTEVEALEKRLIGALEKKLGTVVAVADSPICAYSPQSGRRLARSQGCGAGDFAADAYWWYVREKAGLDCDFAILNGGNVRADLRKGNVTYKALNMVQPFKNSIGVVEVDGQTVLEALEFSVHLVGAAENGGFLHVAGLRYSVNVNIKSGVRVSTSGTWTGAPSGAGRVHGVEVYDRKVGRFVPLDLGATYRVAGSVFTFVEGGDGFSMFKRAVSVNKAVAVDYEALAEYAKAFSTGRDGVPHLSSENAPLRKLTNYPVAYENPDGSGRIRIVK